MGCRTADEDTCGEIDGLEPCQRTSNFTRFATRHVRTLMHLTYSFDTTPRKSTEEHLAEDQHGVLVV